MRMYVCITGDELFLEMCFEGSGGVGASRALFLPWLIGQFDEMDGNVLDLHPEMTTRWDIMTCHAFCFLWRQYYTRNLAAIAIRRWCLWFVRPRLMWCVLFTLMKESSSKNVALVSPFPCLNFGHSHLHRPSVYRLSMPPSNCPVGPRWSFSWLVSQSELCKGCFNFSSFFHGACVAELGEHWHWHGRDGWA